MSKELSDIGFIKDCPDCAVLNGLCYFHELYGEPKQNKMNKPLSVEELLKPRYKVIADYPLMPYKVGDIITMPLNNRSFHLVTVEYTDEFGENARQQNHYAPSEILRYPHLFKKLEWWEEREVEQMPKYLKCIRSYSYRTIGGSQYYWHDKGIVYKIGEVRKINYDSYLPATEEEYLTYINNNK